MTTLLPYPYPSGQPAITTRPASAANIVGAALLAMSMPLWYQAYLWVMVPAVGQTKAPEATTVPASGVICFTLATGDQRTSDGLTPSGTITVWPMASSKVSSFTKVL